MLYMSSMKVGFAGEMDARGNVPSGGKSDLSKNYDQFYTKDTVAEECFKETIDFLKNSLPDFRLDDVMFLEPSAGGGAFMRAITARFCHCFACDIDPKCDGIIRKDFLKDDISDSLPESGDVITIGNPPFGKRSRLAADFINKAAQYSDIIAFILPLQFQKYSAQNKLNSALRLVLDKKIDPESFVFQDKSYSVRCCFQIWTTKKFGKDLRLRSTPVTTHRDFEMWQYNNTRGAEKYFDKSEYGWDFAVPRQGYKDYTLKETNPAKMDRHTQWIFFKARTPEVLDRLAQIDFEKLSRKNTSVPGFGKADVIDEYNRMFGTAEDYAEEIFNVLSGTSLGEYTFNLGRDRLAA